MIGAIWIFCAMAAATDGDSLHCRSVNGAEYDIRVHALHAPELRDDGGPLARDTLAGLLEDQWLTCLPVGRSYSRLVSDCYIRGDRDLARAMIESGAARWCPRYGRPDLAGTPDNGIPLPLYCEE